MQSCRFFVFFSQSFYTQRCPCVCKRNKIVWLRCEKHSQNYPKNGQKTAVFRLFLIFAKTVHTIRTKLCTILQYIMVLFVCNFIKFVLLGGEKHRQKQPKNVQKAAIFRLLIFAKTVHTIRTKFSTVIFYTIIWSYVCNFAKFV